jgi:lipopolysaccharide export system protein LptC
MSAQADQNRDTRQRWAKPFSGHDRTIKIAMIVLPSAIGALAAVLVIAPLLTRSEISFVLDKNKVSKAPERLKVTEAEYRGQDDKGRAFAVSAGGAVQQTSDLPVVAMTDLSARMTLTDGPATIQAPRARYDIDKEMIDVDGSLIFKSSGGYALQTANVAVDLKKRTMASKAPVTGQTRLGSFSGDRMRADLEARSVTLDGRARLHIVQGAVRGR